MVVWQGVLVVFLWSLVLIERVELEVWSGRVWFSEFLEFLVVFGEVRWYFGMEFW